MKINDQEIISTAQQLRDQQNRQMVVPTNPVGRPKSRGVWYAAAASLAGFLLGFGAYTMVTPSDTIRQTAVVDSLRQELMMAQQQAPVIQREVVRDTIIQKEIITREVVREVPLVAQDVTVGNAPSAVDTDDAQESVGCSMMCDDIRYDLLATY